MGAETPGTDTTDPHSPRSGRPRRVVLGLSTGALLVVLAGVVALLATGGAKKAGPPRAPTSARGPAGPVATAGAILGGIPQHTNTLGSPAAPVTLVYFGDLECPFCREFTLDALPRIVARFVRPGKLQIVYRSLETATRQPSVFLTQQVAAMAAAPQGKMWDYVELFYEEQREENSGYVNEPFLEHLAQQIPGLDLPRWMGDRNQPLLAKVVAEDGKVARNAGATGTPALFFGRTGGPLTLYRSLPPSDPAAAEKVIERLLKTDAPRSPSRPHYHARRARTASIA